MLAVLLQYRLEACVPELALILLGHKDHAPTSYTRLAYSVGVSALACHHRQSHIHRGALERTCERYAVPKVPAEEAVAHEARARDHQQHSTRRTR